MDAGPTAEAERGQRPQKVAATSSVGGASADRNSTYSTSRMTARIAGISNSRSRAPRRRARRALGRQAHRPVRRVPRRWSNGAAPQCIEGRPDDGAASMITDQRLRPVGDWPAGVADTTPGVVSIACCTASARSLSGRPRSAGRSSRPGNALRACRIRSPNRPSRGTARSATARSGAQQATCQHRQPQDRDAADQSRSPRDRFGDAMPRARVDGVRGAGSRDERPEQPASAQRQHRRQHQQHEHGGDHQSGRRQRAEAAGARGRSPEATSVAPARRWRCWPRSPAPPRAPPGAAPDGDRRCAATLLGIGRSPAARSWCRPRTPARW